MSTLHSLIRASLAVCLAITMDQAPSVTLFVPGPLRQYCAGVAELPLAAPTARAALEQLERRELALYRNVCDETGTVRRHLNVFVNADHGRDLDGMDTRLPITLILNWRPPATK